MKVFEVFGLAFIGLVVINLISMTWAIKKARFDDNSILEIETQISSNKMLG